MFTHLQGLPVKQIQQWLMGDKRTKFKVISAPLPIEHYSVAQGERIRQPLEWRKDTIITSYSMEDLQRASDNGNLEGLLRFRSANWQQVINHQRRSTFFRTWQNKRRRRR